MHLSLSELSEFYMQYVRGSYAVNSLGDKIINPQSHENKSTEHHKLYDMQFASPLGSTSLPLL